MGTESSVKQRRKIEKLEGVQVYGRLDEQGRASELDAVDNDEDRIARLADRFQRQGYGVMRWKHPRAGKIYYMLDATWAGNGPPPDGPKQDAD